ncbi:MAG: porin [Myxococcota bacterium]
MTAWTLVALVASAEEGDPMQEAPVVAGVRYRPGKGLVVESEDGRFSLTSRWRVQLRYELEVPGGGDPAEQALQLRRARWTWTGHFFGEDNRFKLDLNLAPQDVKLDAEGIHAGPLRDAYLRFTQLDDLQLSVGQMKIPFGRQFLDSSGNLMLVDRSIVHDEFSLDRDLGLQLSSDDLGDAGLVSYALGLFGGEGPYTYELSDLALLWCARVSITPFGPFAEYSESDQARSETPKLAVGAAVAWLDEAKRDKGIAGSLPSDGGTTDTRNATADVAFRYQGVSVDAAFHWRDGDRTPGDLGPVAPPRDGVGAMAQAGWLLPGLPLEPSLQAATVRPSHPRSALAPEDDVGLGLSWYFAEHAYKLQGDVFRATTPGAHDPDVRARVQLQASI